MVAAPDLTCFPGMPKNLLRHFMEWFSIPSSSCNSADLMFAKDYEVESA